MTVERTIIFIKPDAIDKGIVGQILDRVEKLGLKLVHLQTRRLSRSQLRQIYFQTRKNKPAIYRLYEQFMSGEPTIVGIVEGKDALDKVYQLRGPTDLNKARPGTIRHDFITDQERRKFRREIYVRNVFHASETKEEVDHQIAVILGKKRHG